MPYSSLDLAEGLAQQARPPAGVPLNIPLVLPKPEPGKEQPETAYQRQRKIEEQERNRLLFDEQRKQAEARELEILKREQAQRDYLRNKVNSVYENNPPPKSATERVWNKYTGTYQERPLGYPSSTDRASVPPSSASPPATPRNSGSGLGMNMQDSPATGSPRTATAPVDVMDRPPTSLPVPAAEINAVQSLARNAATGGAITGVVDFAGQVMSGRPVVDAAGHAAFSGVGGTAGTIIGASAGSALGPVGSYVGGMVGGMVGAGVGGFLYDQIFPRPAQLPQQSPAEMYESSPTFQGGQGNAVMYRITFTGTRVYSNGSEFNENVEFAVFGPISSIRYGLIKDLQPDPYQGVGVEINCRGVYWLGGNQYFNHVEPQGNYGKFLGQDTPAGFKHSNFTVSRWDGQPDTDGNPPSPPLTIDNRTYTQINNQTTYTTPRAEPAAGQIPAPAAYAPSSLAAKENGTARGDSPDWVPHGGLSGTLHPDTIPLPGALPSTEPVTSPQNGTLTSPLGGTTQVQADGTVVFTSPSTRNLDQPLPGITNSTSLDPTFTSANQTTVQPQPYLSLPPQTAKSQPQPDATKPFPTVAPESPTQSTTQPATDSVSKTDLEQFKKDLEKLLLGGTILAGLTPAIQSIGEKINKIGENTTPESLTTAAAAGTCRTTQPGGCTTKALDDAVGRVNQNTNDKLKNAGSLADIPELKLLDIINNKLGDQVPGGISGFLGRFAKSIHLDKILNALTLITTLHNAAMLSRNLASTLGEVTAQALSVIGLKDENDSPIDINGILSKQINEFVENLIGKEVWTGVKVAWNKASTIIASASQIVYTVRSMFDSAREVTEWIANNTGKIGNALKRFRVVGENAYPHMSENVTHQNAWMLKIQKYREGVDNLDDAASSLQGVLGEVGSIQSEFKELNEQKQKFDKAITDATPKTTPDNTPVKARRETELAASKAPANVADVFRGEGETPNA